MVTKLELHADNTMTLSGRPNDPSRWRIEATDPAVARTAFLIFGADLAHRID